MDREQTALAIVAGSFRRQKVLLLFCWTMILAFAIVYALFSRPIYRAELVLAPVESERGSSLVSSLGGQVGQLASFAGLNAGNAGNLYTHLALLTSKEFTRDFILNNALLPVLYEDDWNFDDGTWKHGQEKTMWKVLSDFDRKVRSVDYDVTTGIVRLRIDWYSGEVASRWANEMGDQLNAMIRRRAIQEANDSVRYLKEALAKNSIVGVEQSMNRLLESQINKIMMANVRKDYAFQVIDPAMPPAESAQLRPNRPLIIAIGLVFGFVFGGFVAVSVDAARNV